jgi:hypothetical protein
MNWHRTCLLAKNWCDSMKTTTQSMPIREQAGIQFPATSVVDSQQRSTKQAGAHIIAAALMPIDQAMANAALAERHWRRNYPRYFRALVESSLCDPALALVSAQAGLGAAWEAMQWEAQAPRTPSQSLESAKQMFAASSPAEAPELATHTLGGKGDATPAPWQVPYRGQMLSGDSLAMQIDRWLDGGIIEPSAADALHRCIRHPQWFDLSDRRLVLLGAGSEAGPLRWLARWCAQLIAVDINRPAVWQKIAGIVNSGNATLHVPIKGMLGADWTQSAGANLLTDTPSLASWISSFKGPLDVAAHAYLDGERHVRVSLAMDWIARAACEAHPETTLAYMATPTDVFAIPQEAALAAQQAYAQRSLSTRAMQHPLRLATGDRFFQPNVEQLHAGPDGTRYALVDSLVIEQGPNYALAKRLQQWRAIVARAQGRRVSLNIAPSTTTASVLKNPALAAGFAGADSFGIEVFEPETTNALMAALWVHDLRSDASAANPARCLAHPAELFIDNACHGGLWRSAYLPRTALPFAAALGWVRSRFD